MTKDLCGKMEFLLFPYSLGGQQFPVLLRFNLPKKGPLTVSNIVLIW